MGGAREAGGGGEVVTHFPWVFATLSSLSYQLTSSHKLIQDFFLMHVPKALHNHASKTCLVKTCRNAFFHNTFYRLSRLGCSL